MKSSNLKLTAFATALLLTACGGGGSASLPFAPAASKSASITGPITGFGSVIVNGVEYRTDNAIFNINNESNHSQNDLSVGQIVTMDGSKDSNGNYTADRVHYQAEVEGLISAIDTSTNSITVLGQTIKVNASTIFVHVSDLSGLKVNDPVEISGTRNSAGTIVAAAVKKETVQKNSSELHGVASAVDAKASTLMIGSLAVDYSKAKITPTNAVIANGSRIELKGAIDNSTGKLIASAVHLEKDGDNVQSGSDSGIEGVIQTVAADISSFTVNNITVLVGSETNFQNSHTKSDLVPGARVEVEGINQADGTVKASRIEFDASNAQALSGVAGTVSGVDQTSKTFSVLGLKLTASPKTAVSSDDDNHQFKFSNLSNGDRVLVGFAPKEGVLTAVKIQRQKSAQTPRDAVRSTNVTTDKPNSKLTIATVPVTTNASTSYFVAGKTADANGFFTAASHKGAVVSATGTYDPMATVLTATEASVLKAASSDSSNDESQP